MAIIERTEEEQIPGLLVLVDFEKAFDFLEWDFMFKCLNFLGFGESIIKKCFGFPSFGKQVINPCF
jgi:hypothetical protein